MKYLAAYALLVLGGNENPTADDLSKLFKGVGVAVDKERLACMLEKIATSGKSLTQLIHEGEGKFATMAPAGEAGAVTQSDVPVKEDAKEAAKAEGSCNEEDVDMGGLFGDDDY